MIGGVADTHAALWYLFGDANLSRAAADFIQNAANWRLKVALSAITLAEVVYLVEKNRLPAAAYEELTRAIADPEHVFAEAALTAGIVQSMRQVPRAAIPDMPDRIVAATAIYFNVPLITRDERIRSATVQTVW